MKAIYRDSQEVTILETKDRGWSYVQFADGMERNVRTNELEVVKEEIEEFTYEQALALEESFELTPGLRTCGNTQYDPNRYVKAKSLNGNYTLNNGDAIAQELATMTLNEVYGFVAIVMNLGEAGENQLRAKYSHLNPGMQRMNLGNRFRAWVKKNTKTTESRV